MPQSLPLEHLNHLALTVRNTEISRQFYCQVLGFREVKRPPFDFPGAWLVGYGVQIHLLEKPEYAPQRHEQPNTRGVHYAFALQSDVSVRSILTEHGIPFIQKVNAGGVRQTFFHDPDGHTIEVAVYPADPDFVE